jgi:hypothetical protein
VAGDVLAFPLARSRLVACLHVIAFASHPLAALAGSVRIGRKV